MEEWNDGIRTAGIMEEWKNGMMGKEVTRCGL